LAQKPHTKFVTISKTYFYIMIKLYCYNTLNYIKDEQQRL